MALLESILVACLFLGLGHCLTVDDCPVNLQRDKTLFFHDNVCYRVVNKNHKSFWDAELDCEQEGGTLVVIKSEDVNTLIVDELRINNVWEFGAWIGLFDEQEEGSFKWKDGTYLRIDDYRNWGEDEGKKLVPGDTHHPDFDEDCVKLSPYTKTWHDSECKDWQTKKPIVAPYVCQYKRTDVLPTTPATTTPVPTTPAPTTPVATTTVPSTPVPTTNVPTTTVPTTTVPTTTIPTTTAPTTTAPTTAVPNTTAPTTPVPKTTVPTTPVPNTTVPTTRLWTPEPTCPPFDCTLECGMDGYLINAQGCAVCQCDA